MNYKNPKEINNPLYIFIINHVLNYNKSMKSIEIYIIIEL